MVKDKNKVCTFRLQEKTINTFNKLVEDNKTTKDKLLREMIEKYQSEINFKKEIDELLRKQNEMFEYLLLLVKTNQELKNITSQEKMEKIVMGRSRYRVFIDEKINTLKEEAEDENH